MTHSILAPSSSARRVQCPMSTTAEAKYPDTDRTEALEGEAAHWALAETLHGRVVAEGQIAPNGVYLTGEMIDGAEVMRDAIQRELDPFGMTPIQGAIEQMVRIPWVHPQSFGTPDYRVWLPTAPRPTLSLWDYKFGHRFVDAYECWQCIEYVSGVLSEHDDLLIDVRIHIVQPRSFHRSGPVRTWAFPASDLRGYINRASAAAHEALGPNPTARTGPECRDCKARFACPTFLQACYIGIDLSGKDQPFDLPPEALALQLRTVRTALERLRALDVGLTQQALSLCTAGQRLPGWAVEHGAGRTRWTKPGTSVIQIGHMTGFDLAKPPEAITPTQARAKGFPLDAFVGLVETPRGAPTLVEDDGSRAARVFGQS